MRMVPQLPMGVAMVPDTAQETPGRTLRDFLFFPLEPLISGQSLASSAGCAWLSGRARAPSQLRGWPTRTAPSALQGSRKGPGFWPGSFGEDLGSQKGIPRCGHSRMETGREARKKLDLELSSHEHTFGEQAEKVAL